VNVLKLYFAFLKRPKTKNKILFYKFFLHIFFNFINVKIEKYALRKLYRKLIGKNGLLYHLFLS